MSFLDSNINCYPEKKFYTYLIFVFNDCIWGTIARTVFLHIVFVFSNIDINILVPKLPVSVGLYNNLDTFDFFVLFDF